MPNKETEIVVSEKNISMKDEALKQAKLYAKDCIRDSEKYLVHMAKVWIDRMIRRWIDAVG